MARTDDVQIKLGKGIFYVTCAVSLWFFYWLAGIQCPCLQAEEPPAAVEEK